MKPYEQNIVTIEAMFTGYVEALHRLQGASFAHDPVMTYIPLFEALNWAVALDDRARAHFAPEGVPLNWGWRDRIPNAAILTGVRFARNRAHHQWSDALLLVYGGPSQADPPPNASHEWVWRLADELPPPSRPHSPRLEGEHLYREQMEGRPALHILTVLGGVFLTLQRLLEPDSISREPEGYAPVSEDADDTGAFPPHV